MRRPILAPLFAILALALGACGGDSGDDGAKRESAPVATTSTVTMSELEFAPSAVTVAAEAGLAVRNAGSVGHDLKLRRDAEEAGGTQVINPGETQQLQVLFDPGDYEMYCSVPGHEQSGMKGTFTVVE
jgi:uncharacterized cupredoxin-like copper-binding protein